jgi:hypothetical protein
MEIKRSDVERWVRGDRLGGVDVSNIDCADIIARAKNPNATVFGELPESVQSVLKNAPNWRVQMYTGDGHWQGAKGGDPIDPDHAYRLHHDCTLVKAEKWVECEVSKADVPGRAWWRLFDDGFEMTLREVSDYEDFVCIKVVDADGATGYIPSWFGPHCFLNMGRTVEELIGTGGGVTVTRPLTPTHVVFKGGA